MTAESDTAESDDEEPTEPPAGGETVPEVELGLYQASVRVQGRADDDLDTVTDSARELIDYLIEKAETLEDQPDGRGLG